MTGKLSKAQRLALAAALAPDLRGEKPKRKVKVYDQKTGETTGEIDNLELTKRLLKRDDIEFSTWPADPREQTVCAGPGEEAEECPDGKAPPARALGAYWIRQRDGRPWRCPYCAAKCPVNREKKSAAAILRRKKMTAKERRRMHARLHSKESRIKAAKALRTTTHRTAAASRAKIQMASMASRDLARATLVRTRANAAKKKSAKL